MEDNPGLYPYRRGFFDEFGDWLDGPSWRAGFVYVCFAALALLVLYGIFAISIYCGYWLGTGIALVFQSREAFEEGLPLLTNADHFAHLWITLPVWCILSYHQFINCPTVEVMEGGMMVERRTWPNHSLWFYLVFVLLLPTIAGFVSAVW